MEKLRALLADAQAWLSAASPREKRLLALAAGGVLVFVALVGWASFSAASRKALAALEEKQLDFEKISKLSAGYGAQEQERQLLEVKLRQSPPQLMGFMDTLAKQAGLEIGGMSDRGVQSGGQNGKPKEASVEVSLNKVPLEKVMKLLQDIDKSPGVVRVRRLRIHKNFENKDVLDVQVSVSAWQGS